MVLALNYPNHTSRTCPVRTSEHQNLIHSNTYGDAAPITALCYVHSVQAKAHSTVRGQNGEDTGITHGQLGAEAFELLGRRSNAQGVERTQGGRLHFDSPD